jgi:hypothetical protein
MPFPKGQLFPQGQTALLTAGRRWRQTTRYSTGSIHCGHARQSHCLLILHTSILQLIPNTVGGQLGPRCSVLHQQLRASQTAVHSDPPCMADILPLTCTLQVGQPAPEHGQMTDQEVQQAMRSASVRLGVVILFSVWGLRMCEGAGAWG